MKIANLPRHQASAPKAPATPPDPTPEQPKDKLSIDWKRAGRAAIRGAAIVGTGAITSQLSPNPNLGLAVAGATGVALAVETKDPIAFLGGAFLSHVGFSAGARMGAAGALLGLGAGALLLGLTDVRNQMMERV